MVHTRSWSPFLVKLDAQSHWNSATPGVVGAYDVADLRYVAFVFPVGAVFVLYLYHDDGTSVLYGHTGYLLGNGFFEDTYTLHKVGVGFAQADIFFLE